MNPQNIFSILQCRFAADHVNVIADFARRSQSVRISSSAWQTRLVEVDVKDQKHSSSCHEFTSTWTLIARTIVPCSSCFLCKRTPRGSLCRQNCPSACCAAGHDPLKSFVPCFQEHCGGVCRRRLGSTPYEVAMHAMPKI